jgi:Icc protein
VEEEAQMAKTPPDDPALRIGLITDIHLGPDRETRLGTTAPQLLEGFLEDMRRFDPAMIVDLGDRIMEVDAPSDRDHTRLVHEVLGWAQIPVHHLLGNHDVAHLPKPELLELLGLPSAYRWVGASGYRCLFLDSTDPVVGEYGGDISAPQLTWLEATLAASRRPAIVFCHHALDDQPIERNPLFREHPGWAMVESRRAVRRVLSRSGSVAAVVTGHTHWNHTSVVDRIPYLTIQGLVETWTTGGVAAGAYGKLSVGPGACARLVVEGRDPLNVELALPPAGTANG